MPPKQQASKKTEQKKKDKVADDRTFGLKNKKGAKQQKYVQQVVAQVRFVASCSFCGFNNCCFLQTKGTSLRAIEEEKAKKKLDAKKVSIVPLYLFWLMFFRMNLLISMQF